MQHDNKNEDWFKNLMLTMGFYKEDMEVPFLLEDVLEWVESWLGVIDE